MVHSKRSSQARILCSAPCDKGHQQCSSDLSSADSDLAVSCSELRAAFHASKCCNDSICRTMGRLCL
jgi:hypothetical protein